MAFVLTGLPVASSLSYDEAQALYKRIIGDTGSGPLEAGDVGQSIVAGMLKAYWRIYAGLRARGFSDAQITSWLEDGAEGAVHHLYLSAFYWGRDPAVVNDTSYWDPILKSYEDNWLEIEGGRTIFDKNGVLLDPDEGAVAAGFQQEEHSTRNGQAACEHDRVFDWNYKQFAGSSLGDIAAGRRFDNTRTG